MDWRRTWDLATKPHPSVQGVAPQRRARLAAALRLVLAPLSTVFAGAFAVPPEGGRAVS